MDALLVSILIETLIILAVNIMGFNAITSIMNSILMELKKKEDSNDKI